MRRLLILAAATLCLGAASERLATFELSGVELFDVLPLVPGQRTAIAHETAITAVPQTFEGWAFTAAAVGKSSYTILPRSTGTVYIAAERQSATGKDWAAWKDCGSDISLKRRRWRGEYRVFSREAHMGKRFKTPSEPYLIVLIPPDAPVRAPAAGKGEGADPKGLDVKQDAAAKVTLSGGTFELGVLRDGQSAFVSHPYVWEGVPADLDGWSVTRVDAKTCKGAEWRVDVGKAGYVYVAVLAGHAAAYERAPGGSRTGLSFGFNDRQHGRMEVWRRQVPDSVRLPQAQMAVLIPPG